MPLRNSRVGFLSVPVESWWGRLQTFIGAVPCGMGRDELGPNSSQEYTVQLKYSSLGRTGTLWENGEGGSARWRENSQRCIKGRHIYLLVKASHSPTSLYSQKGSS